MADWRAFFDAIPPLSVHIVYGTDPSGALLRDRALETALVFAEARPPTRSASVDPTEPPSTIVLARGASNGDNLSEAFAYAMRHSDRQPMTVIVAERPSEVVIPPSSEHVVRSFPPEGDIVYFSVSRHDPGPERELHRALEVYYVWVQAERRPPMPIFFPGRPRADQNFRALVEKAPIAPSSARAFAAIVASDVFEGRLEVDRAIDVMLRAFRGAQPRELISSMADPEGDVSDLFMESPSASILLFTEEDEPEEEEQPGAALVARFDTPMPPGTKIGPAVVVYYEYDITTEELVDETTGEKFTVVDRENCRPVRMAALVATEDLDPATWKTTIGGVPIVSQAAIARYEADPTARGTAFADLSVGGREYETVIVDQSKHWSAAMAHAPKATLDPPADKFARAFANASVDDDGEITLLRPVRAGEIITIDYGDEFFEDLPEEKSGSFPHFSMNLIEEPPETSDEAEELLDVMFTHVWSALEAERLRFVDRFMNLAARFLIGTNDDPLAFNLCSADVPRARVDDEAAASKRIFEKIIEAKAAVLLTVVSSIVTADRAGDFVDELKAKQISSTDPNELWELAKIEWRQLDEYMDGIAKSDSVLHAELNQIVRVMEKESARVMNPLYNEVIDMREPQLGRDFVLPYTFAAVLEVAQARKRKQLEVWKKLFRDAGVDADKSISWEAARAAQIETGASIMRVPAEGERKRLREFVEFWSAYPELTVAGPSGERALIFTTAELIKIRDEEQRQRKTGDRQDENEMREEEGRRTLEEEEEWERRRDVRVAQERVRDERREANETEFDRIGSIIIYRRGGRGQTFDLWNRDSVLSLISIIEDTYKQLMSEINRNKTKVKVWAAWKALAQAAYEKTSSGVYSITSKFHEFVKRAIRILAEVDEYERTHHPKKYKKALADLGLARIKKKKRKKEKKKKARLRKPDSPIKATSPPRRPPSPPSPPPSPRRPSPPRPQRPSYAFEGVARALASVKRTSNDSVFFFYNTRGEGMTGTFANAYPNGTTLHKIEPGYVGSAGGVIEISDVTQRVTHFFVLYGGDERARDWYNHVPRGGFPPYLIATEEVKDRIDPAAEPVESVRFVLTVGGREEVFGMYRRVEVIEL